MSLLTRLAPLPPMVGLAGLPLSGWAAPVPLYETYQLQARSNFNGAFNIPNSAFFTNSTPSLNASGQVAIHLSVIGGSDSKAIFLAQNGSGLLAYISPADAFLSDARMNAAGTAVFPQSFSAINGIYQATTTSSGFVTNQPLGASTWGSPHINSSGQIGFRAGFGSGQAFVSYSAGSTAVHAAEVSIQPGSPYSFLFTPSFNDLRQIAGKVRLGGIGQTSDSQPDQIRIFDSDGTSVLIAEDVNSNASSPYAGFDNSVSLTNNGWVAFNATLVAGGRGVFISNGTETRTIATTGSTISNLEFFWPSANDRGLVAFRAFDASGLRAVWVGNGTSLARVATEHDVLPSDLGDARIDQNDSSPVFGGSPSLNACGDVAFAAALTPTDNNQIEWGSGLYIAHASTNADFNADTVVDVVDFLDYLDLFSQQSGEADLNCDGAIDILDLLDFLDAFSRQQ
jgi:hypothetical protein